MNKVAITLTLVACSAAYGFAQRPLLAPVPGVVGEPKSGGVFLVDLNHDGHLDLLTGHILRKRLAVWSGDGHGEFTAAAGSPFPVGAGTYHLTTGDVNEDGKLDIAASSFGSGGVTLLLGR